MGEWWANSEQNAYMAALDKLEPSERCWCGWSEAGKCNAPECPTGETLADKMAVWCADCHNAPSPDGSRAIVHRKGCPAEPPTQEQKP
jgi:hypothetical protein